MSSFCIRHRSCIAVQITIMSCLCIAVKYNVEFERTHLHEFQVSFKKTYDDHKVRTQDSKLILAFARTMRSDVPDQRPKRFKSNGEPGSACKTSTWQPELSTPQVARARCFWTYRSAELRYRKQGTTSTKHSPEPKRWNEQVQGIAAWFVRLLTPR